MNRIVSFIGLPPFLNCENLALGMRYGKAQSSVLIIAGNLGHHALVFNEDDVVRLLRAAVEREGGQIAFAKRHGIDRALVNLILNGKRRVSGAIAKALGLRKVYVAVR